MEGWSEKKEYKKMQPDPYSYEIKTDSHDAKGRRQRKKREGRGGREKDERERRESERKMY